MNLLMMIYENHRFEENYEHGSHRKTLRPLLDSRAEILRAFGIKQINGRTFVFAPQLFASAFWWRE